jgi:hypothetical protein
MAADAMRVRWVAFMEVAPASDVVCGVYTARPTAPEPEISLARIAKGKRGRFGIGKF